MVADGATSTRAAAIDGFAAVLRELRESAGNPSFREMSTRSSAISHTTLHEAAQGNRLPSWATTVEFVKACGADPADYRERWQQADAVLRSRVAPGAPIEADALMPPSDPPADTAPVEGPSDERPSRKRRTQALAGAAGLVVTAAVTIGAIAAFGGDDATTPPRANTLAQSSDCPLRPSAPPSAPPAHPGDAGTLIDDITLPDCSRVKPGVTVQKVWRFKNVGSVAWRGYTLHRVDAPQQRGQCQTIADVPVPDTPPGAMVDVKTDVTTPRTTGLCMARFKMEDATGKYAFPGSRPVYFQIIVG